MKTIAALPLRFEANQGQTDPRVKFLSHGQGYTLFLTQNEAVLSVMEPAKHAEPAQIGKLNSAGNSHRKAASLRVKFSGAAGAARATGKDLLGSQTNYFLGNDPKNWHTGVPNYAAVEYRGLYPGIDTVFHGNRQQFEFDFDVAPGADLSRAELEIEGSTKPSLDALGDIVLKATDQTEVTLASPKIYQEVAGQQREVAGNFVLRNGNRIGFSVGDYDHSLPLVIDPTFTFQYSTYIGGVSPGVDTISGVAIGPSNHAAYLVGTTSSSNFPATTPSIPTSNAYQSTCETCSENAFDSAFVAKFDQDQNLIYYTYLGPENSSVMPDELGEAYGYAIAVDGSGDAYITGQTTSPYFPITANSLTFPTSGQPAFITELSDVVNSTTGAPQQQQLLNSTFLGGSGRDQGNAIALDDLGNIDVVGTTSSEKLATTGAVQSTSAGEYATFLAQINFNSTPSILNYYTYLLGSALDAGTAVAVDASGNVWVGGYTLDPNPPPVAAMTGNTGQTSFPAASKYVYAGFVAKLNITPTYSSSLLYFSYLGGIDTTDSGIDGTQILALALDSAGNAYATGTTNEPDLATASGAIGGGMGATPTVCVGSGKNACPQGFVAEFNPNSTNPNGAAQPLLTYFGGRTPSSPVPFSPNTTGNGIALDQWGDIFVTGSVTTEDFPETGDTPGTGAEQAQLPCAANIAKSLACESAFLVEFSPGAPGVLYSTYLGGASGGPGGSTKDFATGIALDGSSNVYLVGNETSSSFPTFATTPATPLIGTAPDIYEHGFFSVFDFPSGPLVQVSPPIANFGSTPPGQSAPPILLIVSNGGTGTLAIESVTVTNGPFSVVPGLCTGTSTDAAMPHGSYCLFTLSFSPTNGEAAGLTLGSLTIVDNAPQGVPDPVNAGQYDQTYNLEVSYGTAPTLSSISVTPANASIAVGGTLQYAAMGTFSDNSLQNLTNSVSWSADPINGAATISAAGLATGQNVGTATITASEYGVPGTTSLSVTQGATNTSLVVSPSSASYGQPVTLTATVTSTSNGSPVTSGTVTFTDGSATLQTSGPPNASGTFAFTTSSLNVGAHSLSATYNPSSANFGSSTSLPISLTITQATTTTTLTISPAGSLSYGQVLTLTAIVTSNGSPVTSGTVTFTDGSTTLQASVPPNASGTFAFTTSNLNVGTHSLSATYNPSSANFDSSTSLPISLTITEATTTSTLAVSPAGSLSYGQLLTLTATVTSNGSAVTGGSVTFYDETNVLQSGVALNSLGQAVYATAALSAGSHSLSAIYIGMAGYSPSSSTTTTGPVILVITPASTNTSLVSSPSGTVAYQTSVTLTANVSSGGQPLVGVTVYFLDGTTNLGTGTSPTGANGIATYTSSTFTAGPHSFQAGFLGNASYEPSKSTAVALTVTGTSEFATYLPVGPIQLGTVNVGSTTPSQQIIVQNTGTGSLTIVSAALAEGASSPFSFTSPCNGAVLLPTQSCTFTVQFTPVAYGLGQYDFLQIVDSAGLSNSNVPGQSVASGTQRNIELQGNAAVTGHGQLTTIAGSTADPFPLPAGQQFLCSPTTAPLALCNSGFLGNGGLATQAQLWFPTAVAVSPVDGTVYIADDRNLAIRAINPTTGNISTIATDPAGADAVTAVAVDSLGNVYYGDQLGFIFKNGSQFVAGGNGSSIVALTTDSYDNLYVLTTVAGSFETITMFGPQGNFLTFADTSQGIPTGFLGASLFGLAADPSGCNTSSTTATCNVYTYGSANGISNQIIELSISLGSGNVTATAVSPSGVVSGGQTTTSGLVMDSQGNFYLLNEGGNFLQEYTPSSGALTILAGTGVSGYNNYYYPYATDADPFAYNFDGPFPATQTDLNGAYGLWIDSNSNIYIADTANNLVRKFVNQPITPLIDWPAPSPITYPALLSATQLDATAVPSLPTTTSTPIIPGTYVYTPPSGTLLLPGPNQPLSVTFTPTDTADFTTANGSTTITVNQASSTVLTISPPLPAVGAPVTLTVTVSAAQGDISNPGTPTGTVTFLLNGSTPLSGPLSLVGGVKTLTLTTLPVGTDSITASYSGDTNYAASISAPVVVDVGPPIATFNQNGVFSAPVGAVGGSSTGNRPYATVNLVNTGAQPLVLSSVSVTPDNQPASGGAPNNAPFEVSLSGAQCFGAAAGFPVTIPPGQICTISIVFDPTDQNLGSLACPSSLSSARDGYANLACDTIVFTDNAPISNVPNLPANQNQTAYTQTVWVGAPYTWPSLTQLTTSTSGPIAEGVPVILTAQVSSADPLSPIAIPTGGYVTFLTGSTGSTTSLGTARLVQGLATLALGALPPGSDNITAQFPGDMNFHESGSAPQTVQVTPLPVINFAGPATLYSAGSLGFNGVAGAQPLTVLNVGEGSLAFSGTPVISSVSGSFTILQTECSNGATSFPTALPSGVACTLTIFYTPSGTPANDTGAIVFTDNAALSSPASTAAGGSFTQTISLNGAGMTAAPLPLPSATVTIPIITEPITVSDQVTASPVINFGGPAAFFSTSSLGFSGQSGAQPLTVWNVGEGSLVFSGSPALSPSPGPFSITQTVCSGAVASLPTTLPTSYACTFTISYTPSGTPANDTGTLVFTDNAALSSPSSTAAGGSYAQTISLSGANMTAAPPALPSATVTIPTITEPVTVIDTPSVSNTLLGADVVVTPVDTTTGTTPVTLTFSNVTQPGVTSLTTSPTGPAAPAGFQLGNPPIYYNLSTTATYTSIMICINYAGVTFTSLPPQLFHYQKGAWMNVTTSVNTTTMIVCGTTTSLSPFALFQPSASPTTSSISAAGITYGTPGSVTVSVSSGSGTVTGSVSLTVDGGTASTLALTNGSAVFNLGILNAAAHTLSASFSAQGNFLASSAAGTLSVAQAPLTIAANKVTRAYGGLNPTLTASYTGFVNGDTAAELIGTLSCSTPATTASPAGNYPIVCSGQSAANYSITYLPGQLTVTAATPTVTVMPSSSGITTAQPLSVTVGVSGGSGNATPTGTVTLTSGSYSSGAATLSIGSATINVPAGSLATGTDALTASYAGNANYSANSGTASVTVTTPVPPSFTVTGTAVTVSPGAITGNTSTVTVMPSGGFTGNVTLTAAVTSSPAGGQDLPTFSFGTTNPVSITGTTAGTATLTISTTAATSSALAYPNRRGVPWYAAGGATLACLLLFGMPARRRRWQTILGMLALFVALSGGLLACGGGFSGGGGTSNPGTTAGSYTITVTGTSGAITETGTATLTVQ